MDHHEGTKVTKDRKTRALLVSHAVLGAAIEVHRQLGPGLLESIYERALCRELWLRGVDSRRQVAVPITYKGSELPCGVRLDLLVEECVIVEVKSAEKLTQIHCAQLLTYLKLTRYPVGLLLNFNVGLLKHGIRRILFD
jgi:GxxExxY protein